MIKSVNLSYAIELALLNQLSAEGELSETEAELVNERIQVKNGVIKRKHKGINK